MLDTFISFAITGGQDLLFWSGILLYIGPDSVMPVATLLATIIGFLLIFWRFILRMIKKPITRFLARLRGHSEATATSSDAQEQDETQQV